MNKKQPFFKKIGLTLVFGLFGLVLVACGSAKPVMQADAKENDGTITICHATGNIDIPYSPLTVDFTQLAEHSKHSNDLIPAPVDGCPAVLVENANSGKITICHATSSPSNPYNEITIDFNGLNGHGKHAGDLIPAPAAGCALMVTTPTITFTPTITLTPTITFTPNATTVGGNDKKITICHATGNSKKGGGYVMITISINGLNGHGNHARDIIPAPAGGCPN